jgi:hypothetical protein
MADKVEPMPEAEFLDQVEKAKVVPLPPTVEQFIEEYNALCARTGFKIIASPTFVETNHQTFEIGINIAIAKAG